MGNSVPGAASHEIIRNVNHLEIKIVPGRILKVSPIFETYWRFTSKRQGLFMRRLKGVPPPWTDDSVLATHRFTNVYRAADRTSQYLIRNVLYQGAQTADEIFFRTLLFKLFNRIDTWEQLSAKLGPPSWKAFKFKAYDQVLGALLERRESIYSPAYIMPSPPYGGRRKHHNHLHLLEHMMRDQAPRRIAEAKSLQEVFGILRGYPSLGGFLAFQFTIDLNYSELTDFSEMEFVVAGPGARSGIRKCFLDTAGLSDADIIGAMTDRAHYEMERRELPFHTLWGRPLQLIDCQNIFCEVDKYARVAHPEFNAPSGRTRIKRKFNANPDPLPQWYPPKWGINNHIRSETGGPGWT